MKIKIRPDDTSMLQMNDWLAELRDDNPAEPLGHGGAAPASSGARPEALAEPAAPAERPAPAGPAAFAERPAPTGHPAPAGPAAFAERPAPAGPAAPAERPAPAGPAAPAERPAPAGPPAPAEPAGATVRAVIGDQLRMPIMWCEMGSCISWHADPAALGLGDARARAIGAGWRIDAFGRLACPQCQQTDIGFRVSRPVVLWDRHTAMARAARIAAGPGDKTASQHPAANTMAVGRRTR
jgi:hypothetical protein